MGAVKSGTPTALKNLSNDELSHQLIESLRSTVELARLHLSFGDSSGELHLGLKHRKQTLRQLGDQLLLGQQNLIYIKQIGI